MDECQEQTNPSESLLELPVTGDLAADIADHPTKPCAQELQLAPRPLELVGVGIASDRIGEPESPENRSRTRRFLRNRLLQIRRSGRAAQWLGGSSRATRLSRSALVGERAPSSERQ
jgi:hypothetical protein